MKTLILDDKEFNFLQGMFKAAYESRDMLKDQMAETPTNQLFGLLEKVSGMIKDPEVKAKYAQMKADREREDKEMYEALDSLHIKFSYLTNSES